MLKKVMDNSSVNMMNAGNISIVFSPLLLRDRGSGALPDLSSSTFDCVAAMVTGYDAIFGPYSPSAGPRGSGPKKKLNINPVTREESAQLDQEFMVFDESGASASVGPASSEAALSLRDIVKQGALLKNREKKQAVWNYELVERWQDDQFYAFTRGETLVITTNQGYNAPEISRTITYHPFKVGSKLCNIYYPSDDCVQVTSDGISVTLHHGEPKVYVVSN